MEYQDDDEAAEYYSTAFTKGLIQSSIGQETTIANLETLNWSLVMGGHDIKCQNGEWSQTEFLRKWAVIKALRVLSRLSVWLREVVQEGLFTFLGLEKEDEAGSEGRADIACLDEKLLWRIRSEALDGLIQDE